MVSHKGVGCIGWRKEGVADAAILVWCFWQSCNFLTVYCMSSSNATAVLSSLTDSNVIPHLSRHLILNRYYSLKPRLNPQELVQGSWTQWSASA